MEYSNGIIKHELLSTRKNHMDNSNVISYGRFKWNGIKNNKRNECISGTIKRKHSNGILKVDNN